MDAHQKKTVKNIRRPVSREKVLEYLYRHKLKKRYRPVRPHTFANSQGLSTRQLQNEPSHDSKKPLINRNVKARLESNLQFLLENQNLNVERIKNPESFISLNLKKLKAGGGKSLGKIARPNDDRTQTDGSQHSGSSQASKFSRFSWESDAFQAAEQNQNDHRLMPPPPPLPLNPSTRSEHKKSRQIQTPPSVLNRPHVDSLDFNDESFGFESAVNQHGDDQQFPSTTSNQSKSRPRNSVHFVDDSSLGFDFAQTQNETVTHTPSLFSDAPSPSFEDRTKRCKKPSTSSDYSNSINDGFHLYIRSGSSERASADNLIARSSESTMTFADRSGHGTVQKTRIIRSSVSRVGESPYMQQIVIQKMKRKI